VTFTRLDRHWEAPFVLARLILRQRTLRDQTGTVAGVSFTVDMNTLFERFVEQVVRETAQRAGLELAAQAQRRFSQDVRMYPDLLLRRDGRDAAVADAKYKEPDNGQPVEDLYQMLAYCVTLGLPAGLLIYGGPHPLPHQIVRRAGIRLELTGIDLSLSWRDVLQQARDVATQLIAHVEPVGSRAGNGRWEDGALSRAS
jgi:5-methylcytosine-specific restriction enzyme subunit McrC